MEKTATKPLRSMTNAVTMEPNVSETSLIGIKFDLIYWRKYFPYQAEITVECRLLEQARDDQNSSSYRMFELSRLSIT